MSLINVGSYDKSMVSFGKTHAQFVANFVCKFRGYFPWFKGLTYLISYYIIVLLPACDIRILAF